MRESCTYGSVRGARGNSRPYRDFDGATSSRSSAARRHGRSRCTRSRATACGASASSTRTTKTILRGSFATLRSPKLFRTWVGPMARTCGWIFGGTAMTSIGYERSRRSWSACNPTSSWQTRPRRPVPSNGKRGPSQSPRRGQAHAPASARSAPLRAYG